MKKILFSVAILAVAASCSKNEVVDMPQTNEIGFSTLNSNVTTKVANVNAVGKSGTAGSSDNYTVYAVEESSASAWYISDLDITPAATSGNTDSFASSTATYYWPADGASNKLAFYAFAPAAESGQLTEGTASYSTPTIPLTYKVNTTASKDFTIATPITGAYYTSGTEYSGADANGQVNLKFNHMLSKVMLKVVLDTDLAVDHKFTLTDATISVKNHTVAVDAADDTFAQTLSGETTLTDYTYGFSAPATAATSMTGLQELMVAPQESSTDNLTIQLNDLEITNSTGGVYYTEQDPIYTTTQALVKGYAYLITITINAGTKITFSSEITSTGWGSDNDVTLNGTNI